MNKQKNGTKLSSGDINKTSLGKNLAITFVSLFLAAGLAFVFKSFAYSPIPVFNTDPDYWRDRIGYCESGGRYDRIGPSGHTGKYQYDSGTWRSAVGPELAAQYLKHIWRLAMCKKWPLITLLQEEALSHGMLATTAG